MKRPIFVVFFVLTSSCAPGGPHKSDAGAANGAHIGYDQVRPIFATYCAACHPARSGPNWLEYSQAKPYVDNGQLMERAVRQRSMPPPGSPQAAAITERARSVIKRWIEGGGARTSGGAGPANGPGAPNEVPKVVEAQCVHCHGTGQPASQPKIPLLMGQSQSYILTQLSAFKWRDRVDPGAEMNDVALGLSEADMDQAARFYGTGRGQLNAAPVHLSQGDDPLFEQGRRLAAINCVACHMNSFKGGVPSDDAVPILAGQAREYLMDRLIYFHNDPTSNPVMHKMAQDLNHRDIEALATYFCAARVARQSQVALKAGVQNR